MKAILIDVKNQEIKEIEHDNTLENIYNLIDCRVFDVVRIDDVNSIFVDDEGLLQQNQLYFSYNDRALAGSGLILGVDNAGESIASTLTVEDVEAKVQWLSEVYAIEPEIKVSAWRF